jgi:hypothetical protein
MTSDELRCLAAVGYGGIRVRKKFKARNANDINAKPWAAPARNSEALRLPSGHALAAAFIDFLALGPRMWS